MTEKYVCDVCCDDGYECEACGRAAVYGTKDANCESCTISCLAACIEDHDACLEEDLVIMWRDLHSGKE